MSDLRKVLVDTNIWIEFLKQPLPELGELIAEERVVTHPCVIGEVLVGNVQQRPVIRQFLLSLPMAVEADITEVLAMTESRNLFGRGLQWNDVLLLAAAKLTSAHLWTRDKRLAEAAEEFGIGWTG
ncbi:MAG: PIN domain-containing protein [Akkermansiaceae bacterium]|nr:PIN domain-containing protein [Akkermansiaceae bacterium]